MILCLACVFLSMLFNSKIWNKDCEWTRAIKRDLKIIALIEIYRYFSNHCNIFLASTLSPGIFRCFVEWCTVFCADYIYIYLYQLSILILIFIYRLFSLQLLSVFLFSLTFVCITYFTCFVIYTRNFTIRSGTKKLWFSCVLIMSLVVTNDGNGGDMYRGGIFMFLLSSLLCLAPFSYRSLWVHLFVLYVYKLLLPLLQLMLNEWGRVSSGKLLMVGSLLLFITTIIIYWIKKIYRFELNWSAKSPRDYYSRKK